MEKLAYTVKTRGEGDLPEIWSDPLAVVVEALATHKTFQSLSNNLPDVELISYL